MPQSIAQPLNLLLDYTPAIRQSAGIGRIIRGQVRALLAANPGYAIRLFVAGQVSQAERDDAPLRLRTIPFISERNLVRIWHRLNIPLPRADWFAGGRADLLHATDFVLPPASARRRVVTVHDLAFVRYPDAAMPSLHRYLNVVVPRSVRRADHLIADSQHTANDLQELWQIPAARISVVQGAVDQTHFQPVTDPALQRAVREKYAIGERPFILGLSKLQPRKNFARLIRAFHAARNEAALPHRLVIGGGKGWLFDEIFATVQELGLEEDVIFPGFVDDADLPALFSAAEFFAYPSLYEGFGLPSLESQSCGAPVLTADNSCLPEAGGDGALYVKAASVESIAEGIVRLATDGALRRSLVEKGSANAQRFTWERSAQQLIAAYAKAME
ncbi:MAG: glycosyltransferase family 4 protein [Chloroflexi bacterium]|nr:glycosyltransferase family 4 protein [Chloroflexota bacterium]